MFPCDQCRRSFNRPSHLNRHRMTHLPSSRRRVVTCTYCERTFSRQDVLLRHLRATHDVIRDTSVSNQKSCHRCVRHKLRCDREQPCGSCHTAKSTDPCSYPSSAEPGTPSRTLRAPGGSSFSTPSVRRDSERCVRFANHSVVDSRDAFGPCPPAANEGSHIGQQHIDPLDMDAADFSPVFESDGFNTILQPFEVDGWIDFRGSGLDWLDFDVSSIDFDLSGDHSGDADATMASPAADSTNPPAIHSVAAPSTALPRQNVLPWPFEQGQDAQTPRFPLPRLHQILPQPPPGTQPSTVDSLLRLLSCQQIPHLNELTNTNMSPGLELLRRLTDVYFSGFQIVQSIVHAPTWNVADCPTVLLAAMACIGSALSDESDVTELSNSLGDFCGSMITWLGVTDNSSYSDVSYLAALCLHQIYSLGSGNRQLYQNADRTRGVLIGSLRGLGLLSSRISNLQQSATEDAGPTTNDPRELHAEWLAWVACERDRRVAWASFEYDCSLCTLTNRRGAVDLSELPARLPCSDSLWDAQSANAWAALKSRAPSRGQGAMLSGVLGLIISGRPLVEHVSMWGKRLCAQIIGRLLWDLKQLEKLSTPEYCGLPSLFKSHQQSKVSLLRGLDSLLTLMTEPASTSDLISYNISSLLCHYSHMYASDDIMDIIIFIIRNVVSKGPSCDERLDMARQRLTSGFQSDPKRARKLLWHAGQIVAVATEYLVSAPCEIMRLFKAYVFILAYAKYSGYPAEHCNGVKVRLDVPSRHADQEKAVAKYIQHGGQAQIGTAQDVLSRASTANITKDAHVMFQRLHSWGLAEKFAKILQCFENFEE
ncbi:hypothetical protein JDV02_010074 [Purpureocillium takamizusanense]|uniref:Uncharacterized protein n=1 Tax=Purpureocillium takamizusanense TaxID=2060973 RepID=A0A9Q8VH15_9HYPO|nr:uncharacterized protein JDV02_010074 [Purpureocillium takamizusanense]UNI24317.1 hypothetical protein JDV02_010074 [Purpureocillium takamizusanense]